MEIFGWFSLIILALIGVGTITAFVGPSAVEKIKTLVYKAKKFAAVAKEYIDAKAEIKRAKNAEKLNKETVEEKVEAVANTPEDTKTEEIEKETVAEPVVTENTPENKPETSQENQSTVSNLDDSGNQDNNPIVEF